MDAISDDGQFGFSVIVMIGSVFSPYFAWSGRQDPYNHVAFNVGLYGGGKKRWTLTERGRSALTQSRDALSIGPSSIRWDGDDLVLTIEEVAVPIPRRVRGTIRIKTNSCTASAYMLDFQGHHFWQPIAPHARAEVSFDSPNLSWSGDAYFDSNWGTEALEDGFQSWNWCRASLQEGAGIFYDAIMTDGETRRMALRFDAQGAATDIPCPPAKTLKPGPIWRMPRSVPAVQPRDVETLEMLEDTPFYTRSRIKVRFAAEDAVAVHESLDLKRFSKIWIRCLLPFRMPRRDG